MSKAITDITIFDEIISSLIQTGRLSSQVEYDGFIVKKIAGSNSSGKEDTSSGQTHIAITGVQMDLFPNLYASSYEDKTLEVDNRLPFKGFFTLRIPYHISKQNSDSINAGIDFSGNSELVAYGSVVKSYRESSDSHQIELSVKTLDDENFKCFINHLNANDLLVILKRKKQLEYELLGIKATDELYNTFLNYESNLYIRFETPVKTKTPVEVDLFRNSLTRPNNEINYPHNRIIFGAPGTGKSFQINEDARAFGNNYERVTFHPNYSYAQFVGTYKPVMKTIDYVASSESSREIINILKGNDSAQAKYDKLSKYFIDNKRNFCSISTLLGIFTDDDFSTTNKDGTKEAELSAYVNVGKALRDIVSIKELNDDSEITYSYVPGPFIRVLEKALYSQQVGENEPYLLIIEEINRANVAAVFGDVFQLLDRDEYNESQYEIDVSEDLYNYLTSDDNELTGHKKLNIGKKIKIPSNMYIWATMNSADQGVQPIDAAFKRRWDFEYLPLDEHDDDISGYQLPFPKDADYQLESWKEVRKIINNILRKINNINEDKLLGPFFISKNILDKYNVKEGEQINKKMAEEFSNLFKSKVLMYLFEDVCKINSSIVFPGVKTKTGQGKIHFSDICDAFNEMGIKVFKE